MQNKETIDGAVHNRPCYYAIEDINTGLYWLVPISSQVDKYKKIHQKKIEKYGYCDTLVFGIVLGKEKAFLIQNAFPASDEYINNLYYDNSGILVSASDKTMKEVVVSLKNVLKKLRKGRNVIFPDSLKIEKELLKRKAKQAGE